jgi:hypothetical protein
MSKTKNQFTIQRSYYFTPKQAIRLDELQKQLGYPSQSALVRALIAEGSQTIKAYEPENQFNSLRK